MADTRIERDCLGEMEIPNDRYYPESSTTGTRSVDFG